MFKFQSKSVIAFSAAALAAAASLSLAAPASAANLFFGSVTNLAGTDDTYVTTGTVNGFVEGDHVQHLAPSIYHVYSGPSHTEGGFDLLAFCIDPFHPFVEMNDYADVEGELTGPYSYFNASGTVTSGQAEKVAQLVTFGSNYFSTNELDLNADVITNLSAIQGAIWKVLNPTLTFTAFELVNGGMSPDHLDQPLSTLITQYADGTIPLGLGPQTNFRALVNVGGGENGAPSQSLGILAEASAAVPEPGMWVMMVFGAFSLGGMLRHQRRQALAA